MPAYMWGLLWLYWYIHLYLSIFLYLYFHIFFIRFFICISLISVLLCMFSVNWRLYCSICSALYYSCICIDLSVIALPQIRADQPFLFHHLEQMMPIPRPSTSPSFSFVQNYFLFRSPPYSFTSLPQIHLLFFLNICCCSVMCK